MEVKNNGFASTDKVVWQEGMNLDPHHFQQWDRYHESLLNAKIRSIAPLHWGLCEIQIDQDRLANGEFALLSAVGVMPDGLGFELGGLSGGLPDSRNVSTYEKFTPTKESLNVYLGVPSFFRDGANIRLPDSLLQRPVRYQVLSTSISDETTGENERQIEVARAHFKVLLEGESMQGYSVLQIAQVKRKSEGGFELADKYVPTCLFIGASSYLKGLVNRVLHNLVTHSAKVKDRALSIFSQRETTPQDVLIFGRLGVVNGNIPIIKHIYEQGSSHPEALYLALVSLAGQLHSYVSTSSVSPNNYPAYDHSNLSHCFNRVEEILHELIHEEAPDARYLHLGFEALKENIYHVDIDQALKMGAALFLTVRSNQIPEHRLVSEIPNAIRVASPQSIDMVVQAAVPALSLSHTSRLPASVPIDDKASYFELHKNGPFWERIKEEKNMAVFLPYSRSQIELQLLVVNN